MCNFIQGQFWCKTRLDSVSIFVQNDIGILNNTLFVIVYADDILLIDQFVSELQKLLSACENGLQLLDIVIDRGADSMGHGGHVPPTFTNGWARGGAP